MPFTLLEVSHTSQEFHTVSSAINGPASCNSKLVRVLRVRCIDCIMTNACAFLWKEFWMCFKRFTTTYLLTGFSMTVKICPVWLVVNKE